MIKILSHWPKATEHFVMLAAAWVSFSLLFGLFGAFDAMEAAGENIATQALIDAMKVAGLMMVGGSLIAGIPLALIAITRNKKC
jgi:hypothetical protein